MHSLQSELLASRTRSRRRLHEARQVRLNIFNGSLEAAELRLRGRGGPLHFVQICNECIHRTVQVRHIEPYRHDEERCIDDKFDNAPEECMATHAVEHLVVLVDETQYLAYFALTIGIHSRHSTMLGFMLQCNNPLVAQWIEQSRPKGEM